MGSKPQCGIHLISLHRPSFDAGLVLRLLTNDLAKGIESKGTRLLLRLAALSMFGLPSQAADATPRADFYLLTALRTAQIMLRQYQHQHVLDYQGRAVRPTRLRMAPWSFSFPFPGATEVGTDNALVGLGHNTKRPPTKIGSYRQAARVVAGSAGQWEQSGV